MTVRPRVALAAPTATSIRGGINGGALGLTAPLHPNNNTFQVDQVWFGMRKPATAESRGGWAVDLVWGVGADNIGTPGSVSTSYSGSTKFATGDMPHLYQAYAEYLAPIGGDILIKMGRFQTLIGAEEFRQDRNYNVTRGLLWALQPDNHTGVTVGSDYDNGVTWTVGVANSYSATMADTDNEKTFIGQAGYRGESFSLLVNGLYGGNPSDLDPSTCSAKLAPGGLVRGNGQRLDRPDRPGGDLGSHREHLGVDQLRLLLVQQRGASTRPRLLLRLRPDEHVRHLDRRPLGRSWRTRARPSASSGCAASTIPTMFYDWRRGGLLRQQWSGHGPVLADGNGRPRTDRQPDRAGRGPLRLGG